MRHPARRKALLVGAVCAVALLGAGVAFREDLAFHYHAWRLDGALTVEAARPLLAKLEGHVQDPARAQRLVAMLGPRRPRLTFWVLKWSETFARERGLRHFARSLEDRARRDEGFLAVMAHFIRWEGAIWLLDNVFFAGIKGVEQLKSDLLRCEPAVQESLSRTLEARLLAEVWLLGMSALPPSVELSFPLSEAAMEGLLRRWEDLVTWVRARRGRLRFDPASGRFEQLQPGHGRPKVPRPAEPLPGWTGPVPRLP